MNVNFKSFVAIARDVKCMNCSNLIRYGEHLMMRKKAKWFYDKLYWQVNERLTRLTISVRLNDKNNNENRKKEKRNKLHILTDKRTAYFVASQWLPTIWFGHFPENCPALIVYDCRWPICQCPFCWWWTDLHRPHRIHRRTSNDAVSYDAFSQWSSVASSWPFQLYWRFSKYIF